MIRKYYQNCDPTRQDPRAVQPMPKTLDFHYGYFCNYDKHIFGIRDLFFNNGAVMSFSDKQLHVWVSQQEIEKVH